MSHKLALWFISIRFRTYLCADLVRLPRGKLLIHPS